MKLRNKKKAIANDTSSIAVDRNNVTAEKLMHRTAKNLKHEITGKLYQVKETIDKHIDDVHTSVTDNAMQTIGYVKKTSGQFIIPPRSRSKSKKIKLDPALETIRRLWDQVNDEEDSTEFAVALKYPPKTSKKNKKIDDKTPNVVKGERIITIERPEQKRIPVDTKLERFRRQSTLNSKNWRKRQVIRLCFQQIFLFSQFHMLLQYTTYTIHE